MPPGDRAAVPEALAPTWHRAFRYHTGKPHLFLLSGSGASAHTLPVRWAFMRVSNVLLSRIRERTPSPGPLGQRFCFRGKSYVAFRLAFVSLEDGSSAC